MGDAERALERSAQQMADVLTRLLAEAKNTRTMGLQIPIVDEDPDPEYPVNLWGFADGILHYRTPDGTVHEFIPTVAGGTTSGTPIPVDPVVEQYRTTYPATWAQTYCATHGQEGGGLNLHYGTRSSNHGERKIMVGFDDATIRADLAGAEIEKVSLRASNADAFGARVDIYWGAHDESSAPAEYEAVRKNVYRGGWPQVGWGGGLIPWRTISSWFGEAFRDDVIRGLTIDQPSGVTHSGQIEWPSIELAIRYRK